LVAANAHAQLRPDAGQTLDTVRPPPAIPNSNPAAALPTQDERPALSAPDAQRIPVRRWRVTGNKAFSTTELNALIQDRLGQDLTLSELDATAARITAYYRQHGYLLARAYLPEQDIHDGDVEIVVLEGRLAAVNVANTSSVSAPNISEYIERLQTAGPIQGQVLERSLLLLNDLPGVEVRSTLKPGATVGASDLDLRVRDAGRLDGNVDADSFGNRYTGAFRAGGTLNLNSPFHRGDRFTLRANTSGSGMAYGRAAWQTPLGGNGWQVGIAWSDLHYELGKDFKSLDAHGTAQVGSLWAAYPLVRSQARSLTVRLSYDDKRLNDRIDTTATNSHKTLDVWTLGLTADRTDSFGGGGVMSFSLDVIGGRLSLDSKTAALDQGIGGHRTEGRYGKLAYNVSRLQRLSDRLLFYAALSGQVSNKNLDSSETESIGGVYGVRAYPQGEAVGAQAEILNLELRWGLPRMPEVQALLFADAGTVKVNHSPLATDTDNRRTLAGEGIGAQWVRPERLALKAYIAWRSGPKPTSETDRQPRFWLQFAQYF